MLSAAWAHPNTRGLMDPAIREAKLEDLDTVVRFNSAMARETEDKHLDEDILTAGVRRALSDPDCGRYFLAELGGKIVGQMMFTLEWSDWRNGWFWWIQSVYVVPDHRGRRVFAKLYAHLEHLARSEEDVCGLRLYVDADNIRAQSVYSTLGMEHAGYRVMEAVFDRGVSINA